MKYTVTGGLGFIGNSLVNYLLNSGHDVQIIDNLSNVNNSKHDSLENRATFHKIDILNSKKLRNNFYNHIISNFNWEYLSEIFETNVMGINKK